MSSIPGFEVWFDSGLWIAKGSWLEQLMSSISSSSSEKNKKSHEKVSLGKVK
jgi:hypothetical protein